MAIRCWMVFAVLTLSGQVVAGPAQSRIKNRRERRYGGHDDCFILGCHELCEFEEARRRADETAQLAKEMRALVTLEDLSRELIVHREEEERWFVNITERYEREKLILLFLMHADPDLTDCVPERGERP